MDDKKEKVHFFDRPGSLSKVLKIFFCSLVILVIVDLFIHKHPYFGFDGRPSFYGAFGFVAGVVLVLAARFILRPIVKRKEGYYDD
ncbi:MAG TPA: hypothetical protein HPP56_01875 [Nitrospirae bacterium]|nr:hypothetical protein [Nitrospirota bacterium]